MLRALAPNLRTASNSAHPLSRFLFTLAAPESAPLERVTSSDARLSFLRAVHVLMDSSTSMADVAIDGVLIAGAVALAEVREFPNS